ncbi:MAG: beta-lactamase family protein [Nocardioidaceae bacterium]|nr:beta-lactamase family protein [Nocardioidaceae bacterium]
MAELTEQSQRALRRMMLERQSKHRVPGLYGAVVRDGELLWGLGVGSADIQKPDHAPTEDTQFLIASITKTFTATLVMALRDEGKLDLDDSIDAHIPESSQTGVTIRQMLSHVTGMQREPVGDVWDTLTYPDRAQLLDGWNEAERILKPHHRWHYSNLVYAMLGELVARLDGREWAESLRARILDPLGMRRTTVGFSGDHATGYYVPPFSDVPVVEPVLDILALGPAGALASTPVDLATWAAFLADPVDEVLCADTLDEMCQPQTMADLDRWQLAWGLGLMLLRTGERQLVGHTGGMPGHVTGLFVDRQTKTAGMALMNSSAAPDPADLAAELAAYVLDHEPADPELWVPGSSIPAELRAVLGRWYSEGQAFTFSVRSGRLEARAEAAPSYKPPSVFTEVADDLYRTESGRETGELLRITRDSSGAVTKMNWATYLVSREPYAFGEWLDSPSPAEH